MEWTYAKADVSEGFTSEILDIYGYFLFAAPFMTMIPGIINKAVEVWTRGRHSATFTELFTAAKKSGFTVPITADKTAVFQYRCIKQPSLFRKCFRKSLPQNRNGS